MKKAFSKKNLWDNTPLVIKNALGGVLGKLPAQYLLGGKFRTNCRFVRDTQYWQESQIRQYQLNKLRDVLKEAYDKTGFYRQLFDSAGFRPDEFRELNDINKLPVIDKKVIAENISSMCTRPVTGSDVDFASTGGTSGIPLHFYINSGRSAIEYAYLTTSWERAGYKLGTPMAVLRGRVVKQDRNGLYHEYDPILRHHYYSAFHLSDENIERYLKHIETIGSCFLHVYPSSADALAKYILRSGMRAPDNIKGIISESEIVYEQQREMIENVFGCRIFSCYGHSEKLIFASACEKSNNYHVWPTYGYFELLDEQNKPVTVPGSRGEIVGTGFINTVVPFIRYRTGDWATYVSEFCHECGRKHTIIRDIIGHRTQEVLIASDGSEVSWTALNMHDETFLHVKQFQFTQNAPGIAVLRVVPSDGYSSEDEVIIQRNLGRKLDGRISFTVERVKEIPLTSRGKAIYVDQRIKRM